MSVTLVPWLPGFAVLPVAVVGVAGVPQPGAALRHNNKAMATAVGTFKQCRATRVGSAFIIDSIRQIRGQPCRGAQVRRRGRDSNPRGHPRHRQDTLRGEDA
jgi:hypothetical protein